MLLCFDDQSRSQSIIINSYQFSDRMSSIRSSQSKPPNKNGSQIKALFLKNGLLQAKQPCTNICQILTPVICLIFTYLIKQLASQNLPGGVSVEDNPYPYVFGDYTHIDRYSRNFDNKTNTTIPARKNPLEWYIYDCSSADCDPAFLGLNDGSTQILAPDGKTLLGSIVNVEPSTLISNFTINYYTNPANKTSKYLPFFIPSAYGNVNKDLFNNISTIEDGSFLSIKSGRNGLDSLPDGAVTFKVLNKDKMSAVISTNDIRDLQMHRNNGVSGLSEVKKIIGGGQQIVGEVTSPSGFLIIQHYISQAFIWLNTQRSVQSGYVFYRETTQSSAFVDSLINTVSALIFPLALSLLFPVMLYVLVLEKEERLVQMMKMNGMKISSYWLVYIVFNFLLAAITNIVFFLIGNFALSTNFFLKTSPGLLILVAVGWIVAQLGLAAFLQTLLDKARSANIIGYIFAIWTMMIGSTLNIGVYQVPNQFPGWIQAIPPFAFNRLFYLMLIDCSDNDCYNTLSQISPQMKNCITSLYVGGLFFFCLGAYLLEVLPQQFGVKQHPLFPFISFYRWITCKSQFTYSRPGRDEEIKKYLTEDQQDTLSQGQRDIISKMTNVQNYPLVINNLRKLYIKQGYVGPYAAVKSFNLRVAQKETFGLLGPNGAGKTTLINMLTGMINPDYGNAWIGGYDINSTISKAQLQMGVCPQFDLLWPQLTVQEHLRFYARLKGIPGNQLERKVKEAIEEVNLTSFKSFLSSSLSGGMKRRLSIAISLVGDPKIVFLDEPSSGLDPDNRRQIWQVLVRCQDKRALFLTTHMMEQADALCHRIGIITHGTLRTVGNQLRLKKDYGQGYRLSLSLISKQKALISPQSLNLSEQNPNYQDEKQNEETLRRSISELISHEAEGESKSTKRGIKKVADFILKRFPGSSLSRILGGSAIFKIPLQFKISEIFLQMNGAEAELGISNVSITDSSLEDVFIAVVLRFDKIVQDQQTGQVRLKTIDDEYIAQQIIIRSPSVREIKKKSPEQEKFGSIVIKDRESVMSEQIMRRQDGRDE